MPKALQVADSVSNEAAELDRITKVSNRVWAFFERLATPAGAAVPSIADDEKKGELVDRLSALEWAAARRPRRLEIARRRADGISDLVAKAGYFGSVRSVA